MSHNSTSFIHKEKRYSIDRIPHISECMGQAKTEGHYPEVAARCKWLKSHRRVI